MDEIEEEIKDSVNQVNYRPGTWRKGQSGNPKGRPKGKTMKEWAKEYLSKMTEEERDEFMEGIPKEIIWKMSEGNPANNVDVTTKGEQITNVSPEAIALAKEYEEKLRKTL